MSGVPIELVRALITESLAAWGLAARVGQEKNCIFVISDKRQIGIELATADSIFRWLVTVDGRIRPAISLLAVLRQVRRALDPGYATQHVRVAAAPLVPS